MPYSTNPLIALARRAPVLDRAEELALFERYRNDNDRIAANRLVESSLRVVLSVALRFSRYGIALDVLLAEGNVGLVRALDKFDPEQGVRFSTYATYWVRSYVIDHILKSWSLVGGGSGALKTKTFFRLRREAARAFSLHGSSDEAFDVLAERMALPRSKVQRLVCQVEERDVSLGTPAYRDSGHTLLDSLTGGDNQEEQLARLELIERVRPGLAAALEQLNERERFIVNKRLSVDDEEALSLSAIAEIFGVSRERVRQIETRTKQKLRALLGAAGSSQAELAA